MAMASATATSEERTRRLIPSSFLPGVEDRFREIVVTSLRPPWHVGNPKGAELAQPLGNRLRDPKRSERALRSALSAVVFRDPGQQLTIAGRYIEMAARLLGPVLLGLTLLSIRSRVRR